MVVSVLYFPALIRYARIEDKFYSLLDKPRYMTMCELGRITLRLTRDGFNSKLIYLTA